MPSSRRREMLVGMANPVAKLVAVIKPKWREAHFLLGSMLLAVFFGGRVPVCADEPPLPARSEQIERDHSRAAVDSLQQYLALDPGVRGSLAEHVPTKVPLTRGDRRKSEAKVRHPPFGRS